MKPCKLSLEIIKSKRIRSIGRRPGVPQFSDPLDPLATGPKKEE